MNTVPEDSKNDENAASEPLGLGIPPYAVDEFWDLERGALLPVLFYRHKEARSLAAQLALIPAVLDDLSRAGVIVRDALEIKLTPDKARADRQTDATRYRVHIKVPIHAPAEPGRLAALRARYGANDEGTP